MWTSIKSFYKIPKQEKILLLQAVLILYQVKFQMVLFSFQKLSLKYKSISTQKPIELSELQTIRIAISRASRITFWKNKCLVNSIGARILLNKRKIPSIIFLGMRKNDKNDLVAHAWVEVNNFQVVPKEEEYIEVYQF